jgi:hypothetical protein
MIAFSKGTGRPYLKFGEAISFSVRRDRDTNQFSTLLPLWRVNGLDGWLALRIATTPRFRNTATSGAAEFDLLYNRSAGQLVDWYASVGRDEFRSAAAVSSVSRKAFESGLKIRLPLPEKNRLVLPFVGFRLGFRTNELANMGSARIVLEAGFGAW